MGHIYADLELVNAEDVGLVRRHLMGEEEVRSIKISAMVDTGCLYMAINENIQQVLQLPVVDQKTGYLANGQTIECDYVFPIEVRFKNRVARCSAIVLPGDSEPLLGAIPLEEMDVLINPLRQQLIVNPAHPDFPVVSMKMSSGFR